VTDQAALKRVDILAHGSRIANNPARPFQDPFTLRREAVEARAALHEQYAKHILEKFYSARQCRLADAASHGGPAEVTFTRQRKDEFEPIDHQ
jgi:hypothetical protein